MTLNSRWPCRLQLAVPSNGQAEDTVSPRAVECHSMTQRDSQGTDSVDVGTPVPLWSTIAGTQQASTLPKATDMPHMVFVQAACPWCSNSS